MSHLQIWLTFCRVDIQMANSALVYETVNSELNRSEVTEPPPFQQRNSEKKSDWHQFLL